MAKRGLWRRGTPADPAVSGTPAVPDGRVGATTRGRRGSPVARAGRGSRAGEGGSGSTRGSGGRGMGGGGWASIHLANSDTAERCDLPSTDVYRRVGCQPGERRGSD